MALYTLTEKQFHLDAVSRLLLFRPDLSVPKIIEQLKQLSIPYDLSPDYVRALKQEILQERIQYVREETKESVTAQMEVLAQWCVDRLRQVIQEETAIYSKEAGAMVKFVSQANRIRATAEIFKIFDRMTQLKMDLGILERKLGTLGVESDIADAMNLIKMYRDAQGDITNVRIYDTVEEGGTLNEGIGSGGQLASLS